MPQPKFKQGMKVKFCNVTAVVKSVLSAPSGLYYVLTLPSGAKKYNVPEADLSLAASLEDHELRIIQLESLMASMHAIDTPTIDRCIETAKNSLRELSDVLGETARLTGDLPAKRRFMAVQQTLAKVHELENLLRQTELRA